MILDTFKLLGKVAFATGASTGLGAAIALALAEAGRTSPATATTTAPKRRARLRRPQGANSWLYAAICETAPRKLLENALRRFGKIDILVNNAGVIRRTSAVDDSLEDWDTVIEVSLSSIFRLSQLTGKYMIEHHGGKILNIASLLSFQGGITVPAYAASKGGVAQLTRALANEWAGKKMSVNAIAPGYLRTENTLALQRDEVRNRQILERILAGRWGEANDVTGAAVFLCSAPSDCVHGHVLAVEGAWMGR